MAQLFTLSCGLVSHQRSQDVLLPALLAVDHEVDLNGNTLVESCRDGK